MPFKNSSYLHLDFLIVVMDQVVLESAVEPLVVNLALSISTGYPIHFRVESSQVESGSINRHHCIRVRNLCIEEVAPH